MKFMIENNHILNESNMHNWIYTESGFVRVSCTRLQGPGYRAQNDVH